MRQVAFFGVTGLVLAVGQAVAAPPALPAAVFINQTPRALAKLDTPLRAVTVIAPNDVWAVGGTAGLRPGGIFTHFDGKTWQLVGKPLAKSGLSDVSGVASADVWAAGTLMPSGGGSLPLAEHWNGQVWSEVPTPAVNGTFATFSTIVALSDKDVWAGGSYLDNGPEIVPLFEHWDGKAWTIVSGNVAGPIVNKLAAVSSTDIWAVGAYLSSSGEQPFAEHWDGTMWTPVGVPVAGSAIGGELAGVTAISSGDVWAVGTSTLATIQGEITGNPRQTLIEHWNGKAWSVVRSPNIDKPSVSQVNQLRGVAALSANDVWAAGYFEFPDGSGTLFGGLGLHWDGTSWSLAPLADSGAITGYLGMATRGPGSVWAVGAGAFPGNVSGTGPLLTYSPGG